MRATILCIAVLLVLPASSSAADPIFFQSPSGNIACVIASDEARCDILEHTWRAPKRPRSCGEDWGSAIRIGRASRRGAFICHGDTVRSATARRLAIGRTIRAGDMRCTSRADGVRCANRRGHGFLTGRTKYRLF